jgi:serine protein kinase
MQEVPFYAIKGSPVNESPLGLFDAAEDGPSSRASTASRAATSTASSPLGGQAAGGVRRRHPQVQGRQAPPQHPQAGGHRQDRAGRREQPGHLSLVGKVDIRKLETYAQDDPDAYSYSGGLCLANQGLLEFVEMFKAPIKVLHPLLTATQEGNFKGTEGFGAIPFDGVVLAHSNESEWKAFRNNKNNEAFLDRIYIVKVPYCLRVSEEIKIYEKLLRNSRWPGHLRAGHAEDDEPVRHAHAPEGARELASTARCWSTTART